MSFPAGGLRASKIVSGSTILPYSYPPSTTEVVFDSPVAISAGTAYAIVLSAPNAAGDGPYTGMNWRFWSEDHVTAAGALKSTDSGSTWADFGVETQHFYLVTKAGETIKDDIQSDGGSSSCYFGNTTQYAQVFVAGSSYNLTSVVLEVYKYAGVDAGDLVVSLYGGYVFTPPEGTATKKYLVAAANNALYYGTGPDDMAVFTAATGLDTSKHLAMFEAYGKVFVVNGSTKKVADFQNTKLITADIGANPPDRGNILTGGTSGAQMVVDYVTALSGACTIYGYRTTTATFVSETVTGTDNDSNPISFATSGAETAPPHWYNWTVYGGDTTAYGSLPTKATIGCLSGGRLVLNNVDYPHQAPTSAAGNPWDWNTYRTTSDRATVIGSGSAGQIGDIVRALIPARDGQLIIGCANSIHVMIDNPAYGGQMVDIHGTGIYGDHSWCFDSGGNLYFWGTGGIYKLAKGAAQVENITAINLPDLISDTGADPTTHRITMGFDPVRQGVKICVTLLSSGANTNYWLDLKTGGFFPDTHADTHGVYSIFQYDANDPDVRGLLLGSADGYIRVHDDTAANDDTTAIDSYVCFGPIPLAEDGRDGSLEAFDMVLAGGASGTLSDSDGVTMQVWAEDVAETVMEKLNAGTAPKVSVNFAGPGRAWGAKRRRGVRGAYVGIKVGNSTADQTWGMEKILLDGGVPGRRLR